MEYEVYVEPSCDDPTSRKKFPPLRQWPEVMALTVALCDAKQPSPDLKVVGLDFVNILAEFSPGMLAPHQTGLLQVDVPSVRPLVCRLDHLRRPRGLRCCCCCCCC